MTRPRTPYWRAIGWVLVFDAAAVVLTGAIVFGVGAGVVR